MSMHVSCVINQQSVSLDCQPGQTLLSVLHKVLGMTGTKIGCESGSCGACTVLLEGDPVCACLVLAAEVQGKHLTTVEGLGSDTRLHPLQKALAEHQALSCGACGPGMLMAAAALFEHDPQPDSSAVAEALSGNLCACSRYPQIVSALSQAVKTSTEPGGCSRAALARVKGAAVCQVELRPEAALQGAILRSPFAHARILRVDLSCAAQMDGVAAVLSAKDNPELCGNLLARDKVRYQGQPVAIVAAQDAETAKRALAAIDIEYALLPSVTSVRAAMEPDAPLLDETLFTQGVDPAPAQPSNIARRHTSRKGQPDKAFALAEVMLGDEIECLPVLTGGFEPAVSIALNETGEDRVGCDDDSSPPARSLSRQVLPLAELLRLQTGQPVCIKSHPASVLSLTPAVFASFRLGALNDGTLKVAEAVFCCQSGAAAAPLAAEICALAFASYQLPNQNLIAYDVIANTPPQNLHLEAAAMAALLVTETAMDALSRKLRIDPLALRLQNARQRDSLMAASEHEQYRQPVAATGGRGIAHAMGCTHVCDIELDALSGQVRVTRYTVFVGAADAKAGGDDNLFQQALAEAFRQIVNEAVMFDENGSLHDIDVMHYRMPAVLDLPAVEAVWLASSENTEQAEPGASTQSALGVATAVAAAAIANAVANAVGGNLREFPINPASIHKALKRAALRRR